jgi:hypothetical protein
MTFWIKKNTNPLKLPACHLRSTTPTPTWDRMIQGWHMLRRTRDERTMLQKQVALSLHLEFISSQFDQGWNRLVDSRTRADGTAPTASTWRGSSDYQWRPLTTAETAICDAWLQAALCVVQCIPREGATAHERDSTKGATTSGWIWGLVPREAEDRGASRRRRGGNRRITWWGVEEKMTRIQESNRAGSKGRTVLLRCMEGSDHLKKKVSRKRN